MAIPSLANFQIYCYSPLQTTAVVSFASSQLSVLDLFPAHHHLHSLSLASVSADPT